MARNWLLYIPLLYLLYGMSSCAPSNSFSTRYYNENEEALTSIRTRFKTYYAEKPFHVEFKDKNFRYISYEVLSDTMRMIYNFDLEESNFVDTLDKYKYNAANIIELLVDMRAIKCTWISSLDYFENREKKNMVFISVRHNKLKLVLNGEKYYALVFFNERQPTDARGRLTDRADRKRMREINGHVFRKINDRVFYAITGNFR